MSKREFPDTRWTLIRQAQGVEDTSWHRALGELCEIYWYPVYAQIRFRGSSPQDAEDLTQGFFASLLDQNAFGRISSEKGKFRSFLIKALRHYMANDYRKQSTQKRGGDRVILSLDQAQAEERWRDEPAMIEDPERLYELSWARTLIHTSLRQLESEIGSGRQKELFEALRDRLLDGPSAEASKLIAQRFAMTEGAVRLAAFRMRRRLAKLMKLEILQTLGDPSEIDAEIDYLLGLFAQSERRLGPVNGE